MKRALEDESLEMEVDSIPIVTEKNVATCLGSEKSLQEVLELMIEKLRENLKTVDTLMKPQIVMITQDTLKVAALYKALRDKYALGQMPKVSKKRIRKGVTADMIQVHVHKLFARHISVQEHQKSLS